MLGEEEESGRRESGVELRSLLDVEDLVMEVVKPFTHGSLQGLS